jgi:YidC/Oxa1 family membrane protein insertase
MRIHAGLGAAFGPASGLAWGLSIVILVMLIRLCLVPLFVKQVNAQRKMAQHQPQLMELRKKYKNDKQRLNEETMKYYKENGVNPLAGCLPMIPQLIIFFSLFSVLRFIADWKPGHPLQYGFTESVALSAKHTTIFGVHLYDKLLFRTPGSPPLSLHVVIVIVITVVLSATTTFMTVRQSAKRGLMQTSMDPSNPMAQSQKFMQYIVPFFSLTGLYWQYGLVLYWVTTNLWTLGQQYVLLRKYPVGAAAMAADGNIPIGGTAGKPATAPGLTGRPAKPKPGATPGGGAGKPGGGPGKAGSGPGRAGGGAGKPGGAAGKPGTGGRSGAVADKPPASAGRSSEASRSGAGGKPASLSKGSGQADSKPGQVGKSSTGRPAAADTGAGSANGHKPTSGEGGVLRRFGKGRSEPEPPAPAQPETKIVRQQRQRQSRSKRSGKR